MSNTMKKQRKNANNAQLVPINTLTPCAGCAEGLSGECGKCATCPRRILIVGGIERMEALYRQRIEANGDIMEYHSGASAGSGGNKLENFLQRADLVLCPVNCNSHNSCVKVKKLCKKYNKCVHMMKNFSLSAISRTIAVQ